MKLKDTNDFLDVPSRVLYFILGTSHFMLFALLYLHSANNPGTSSSASAIYRLHPAMVSSKYAMCAITRMQCYPLLKMPHVRMTGKMFSKASKKVRLVLPLMIVK